MLYAVCCFWSGRLAQAEYITPEAAGQACTSRQCPRVLDMKGMQEQQGVHWGCRGYKSHTDTRDSNLTRDSRETRAKGTQGALRAARGTHDECILLSAPADPLQLSWVRGQARRCHGRTCSCGHSEAGEGQSHSFGGGRRLIEALVIALGVKLLHHRPPTASIATWNATV